MRLSVKRIYKWGNMVKKASELQVGDEFFYLRKRYKVRRLHSDRVEVVTVRYGLLDAIPPDKEVVKAFPAKNVRLF